MNSLKRLAAVSIAIISLFVSGCADNSIATVGGKVVVDGQPASDGYVSLMPIDGNSRGAGGPIVDGAYSFEITLPRSPSDEKPMPGKYRVEIRVPQVVGKQKLYDTPDSPVAEVKDESLPPKYNDASELTLDVGLGETEKDFDLSTKG